MRNICLIGLFCFAAGCVAPVNSTCDPACGAGTHCDNGACVPDGPVDMAAGGGNDLAGCHPGCSGLTPHCNPSNHCVGCVKDGDCANGSYCKVVSDAVATCTPGCMADDRCGNGEKCCNLRCVDIQNDAANCGGCGMACSGMHQQSKCVAGACAAAACDPGWGDCNKDPKDGCESNLHADPNNCTGCGAVCDVKNAYSGCADGCYMTACKWGFDDCNNNGMDGCETAVLSDPKNCGSCGKSCANLPNAMAGCVNGNCVLSSCNQGFADCDKDPNNGCEALIATDVKNCGSCGNACAQGLICKQGGCTCPNCNIPNASALCVNNMCVFDKCNPGFADCNNNKADGCEVNLTNDKNNCGQCGTVCPLQTPYCGNSMCINGCLLNGMTPQPACLQGVDPVDKVSKWITCQSDCNTAWVAANTGGTYHAGQICNGLGYSKVGMYGGTCGNVCGYCQQGVSCMNLGMMKFDGGGHQGDDMYGPILSFTVHWQCLR
jgi:hypothetical protein